VFCTMVPLSNEKGSSRDQRACGVGRRLYHDYEDYVLVLRENSTTVDSLLHTKCAVEHHVRHRSIYDANGYGDYRGPSYYMCLYLIGAAVALSGTMLRQQ